MIKFEEYKRAHTFFINHYDRLVSQSHRELQIIRYIYASQQKLVLKKNLRTRTYDMLNSDGEILLKTSLRTGASVYYSYFEGSADKHGDYAEFDCNLAEATINFLKVTNHPMFFWLYDTGKTGFYVTDGAGKFRHYWRMENTLFLGCITSWNDEDIMESVHFASKVRDMDWGRSPNVFIEAFQKSEFASLQRIAAMERL